MIMEVEQAKKLTIEKMNTLYNEDFAVLLEQVEKVIESTVSRGEFLVCFCAGRCDCGACCSFKNKAAMIEIAKMLKGLGYKVKFKRIQLDQLYIIILSFHERNQAGMLQVSYVEPADYKIKFYMINRYLFIDGQMYNLQYWDEDIELVCICDIDNNGGIYRRELDVVDLKTAIEYFKTHDDKAIRVRQSVFTKRQYLEFMTVGHDWKKIPFDAKISYEIIYRETPVTVANAAKLLGGKMFMEYLNERSR